MDSIVNSIFSFFTP